MRLFIAICLTDKMKEPLLGLQREIAARGGDCALTKARNMHLTLAFIGEYERPGEVLKAMQSVPFEPFELSLSGAGTFGSILWGGVSCPDSLFGYVRSLKKALSDRGIPFDEKPFKPHITVARKFSGSTGGLNPGGASMTANRISLMSSERTPGGMEYKEIAKVISFSQKKPEK